jgi:dTMP kinase
VRGKFICFIGIDGSGKTTLINETVRRFSEKGIKCKYVWGSYELFILRPFVVLGKKLFWGDKNSREDYITYVSSVNKVGKSGFLSICYQTAVFMEYFIQILFKIGVPLMMKSNIISDRYIYDTVISMKVNLGLKESSMHRIISAFLKIIPVPDLIFFVDVPEETAFSRKTDTPSIDYLRIRRGLFRKTAENHNAVFLDGARPIGELYSLIEGSILSNLIAPANKYIKE